MSGSKRDRRQEQEDYIDKMNKQQNPVPADMMQDIAPEKKKAKKPIYDDKGNEIEQTTEGLKKWA